MKTAKRITSIALCLIIALALVACGGGDALKGTWTCNDENYGTVTFDFNGSGNCSFSNDFYSADGTYTINEQQVTISGVWSEDKIYDFAVTDNGLTLTATDELSPSYSLSKK